MPIQLDSNLKQRLERTLGVERFNELYEGSIKPLEQHAACAIDTKMTVRFVRLLAILAAEHGDSQSYERWLAEIAEAITADAFNANELLLALVRAHEQSAAFLRSL